MSDIYWNNTLSLRTLTPDEDKTPGNVISYNLSPEEVKEKYGNIEPYIPKPIRSIVDKKRSKKNKNNEKITNRLLKPKSFSGENFEYTIKENGIEIKRIDCDLSIQMQLVEMINFIRELQELIILSNNYK